MLATACKNSVNATTRGGMLLGPYPLKSLNHIERIQQKVMCATTVISCYNPTNACDKMGITTFYNEVSSFV